MRDNEAKQVVTPLPRQKCYDDCNDVRKRVGAEGFQLVKAMYGAFLAFVGHFPDVFEVYRYAKDDAIRLRPEGAKDETFLLLFKELFDSCDGNFRHRLAGSPGQPTRSLHISNVPDTFDAETFAECFELYHPSSTRLCDS